MPVHITSRLAAGPVPSFVPVYPTGTHSLLLGNSISEPARGSPTASTQTEAEEPQSPTGPPESYSRFFHRDSISASSDSTNSSPTAAALSTIETPGTSPDTPAFFQSISYPSLPSAMRTGADPKIDPRLPTVPSSKKARNLKNLALNTSNVAQLGRTISSPSLQLNTPIDTPLSPSGPMSSAFMKPVNPPRRRGSALSLTIKTPTVQSFAIPQPIAHPPTTARLKRPQALRQFQSSPSVPLISSGLAPNGGMRLPAFSSQFSNAPLEQDEAGHDDKYDVPPSREEMPEAYPDGPICIYEPHVYLYLEPSAEQALDYDVIFNVASEVRNPFSLGSNPGVPSKSLRIAAEALKTPAMQTDVKAPGKPQPEYIHVPWEHNTDIVPDLHELVRVVDDRVESGKKVLIHCQCGVSRSASLIVAYGIYKNPAVTVQQAYDAVKKRSKWIGPNMNLIMQLQEFRSGLIKSTFNGGAARSQRQAVRVLHSRPTNDGNTSTESGGLSNTSAPQTAPLTRFGPTPIKTTNLGDIEPGPASAPCNFTWPSNQLPSPVQPSIALVPAPTSYVDAAGQVLDANAVLSDVISSGQDVGAAKLQINQAHPNDLAIKSTTIEPFPMIVSSDPPTPRSSTFAMTPFQPAEMSDTATLGLTSPRTFTFAAQLPQRFSPAAVARLGTIRPLEDSTVPSAFAQCHPNRPSAIKPINATISNVEALMSPRAKEFTRNPLHGALPDSSAFANALMSPRATEFTRNPLHEVFASSPPAQRARASTVSTPLDPRSPPLRGGNPIVRDIFDVL